MAKAFDKQIEAWVKRSQLRTDAVAKQSVQDMVAEAQKPRAQGGNMPVDTGFLRNSIGANTTGMPSSPGAVATVVLRWQPVKSPLYIGWTANYARYMERRYAFMRLAQQQWQEIVGRNARKLRNMRDGN